MWNDADSPLAYLITFRTYGTWLHGDERGSTNRFRNKYGSKFLPKESRWEQTSTERLKAAPVLLTSEMRTCVEMAIRAVCEIRDWAMYAVNVRTNHVHVVTAINGEKPGKALNAFKANATRELRAAGLISIERSPWADKGSEKYLWNEKQIADAVEYVLHRQGGDLPGAE